MHAIASHAIPMLFSAYGINLGQGNDGTIGKPGSFVRQSKYHCHNCGVDFTVNHQYKAGMFYGGGHFGDGIIFCPYCGHRHENFTRRNHIYYFSEPEEGKLSTETAPLNIEMIFMEYKQGFILKVKSGTIGMEKRDTESEDIVLRFGKQAEEFRFDIKNRRTTFSILTGCHRAVVKQYELGNPFDLRIYEDSKLLQVQTDNLSEDCKSGTIAFLKTIRDAIRDKWKEIHGYDIGSLFVGYGAVNGRLLFPLSNIAFRMVYPDAGNLPAYLNVNSRVSMDIICGRRVISKEDAARYGDLEEIRKGKDSVSAIIKAFALPDKPKVRKLLTEDIFAAPELARAVSVTGNIDQARNLWNAMRNLVEGEKGSYYSGYQEISLTELYAFLGELREHYKATDIIRMVKKHSLYYIRDTRNLLCRLASEKREAAWKVKPKDLHDWLVEALRLQEEEGYKLEAPEYVKRRLMMQIDSVRFFLPEHTKELVNASNELHNCVRTYGGRVTSGECNIVLMTDDSGKLVACLEVRGKNLVQAKLKHNRPVSQDPKINQAVLDWCEKAGLSAKTHDVKERTITMPETEVSAMTRERMAV